MQDGQEVVFYEDGEPIIDGEAGDLKFRIRTAPHDRFRREGNDLHTSHCYFDSLFCQFQYFWKSWLIGFSACAENSLVGFEMTIKHLDEHLVDLSSKGITKPKDVKKFKGEGMPLHLSNKKGDLYVTFEVLFPTSLTEDQKTKIKEILGRDSWNGGAADRRSWKRGIPTECCGGGEAICVRYTAKEFALGFHFPASAQIFVAWKQNPK
ncbi:hypothetical protein Pfo_017428 [Paulownia fortunei]|nr:hypothetical protein Pfo_017428 [Paulownia fortunei]